MFARDQAPAPPVGSVVLNTLPAPSIATHSDAEGHETDRKPDFSSVSSTAFQVPAPPAGFVELRTWPLLSTATHSEVDAQEMPLSTAPGSRGSGSVQVSGDSTASAGAASQ